MWETLYTMGFEDENIFVLYGNGDDYNSINARYKASTYGFYNGITDYPATIQNVNNILNWLANGSISHGIPQLTSDDFLFIYTFDHGETTGNNNSILFLMNGYITDTQFAYLADQISYGKRVIWMQQCYSGGFIDNLANVNSVITTACSGTEQAFRADDIAPDGNDTRENEITSGKTFHHGEFNYHMFNATNLLTIVGNSLNAYIGTNGKTSVEEIFNWEDGTDSQIASTPQYSDQGNIGSSTYLDVVPSGPENLQVSWNNGHPRLTWTQNPEFDIESYKIYKIVVGETGWACAATVNSQTTSWTDNHVDAGGMLDPLYTIKYKIKAIDEVDNYSDYSIEKTITGTTNYLWKHTDNFTDDSILGYTLNPNYPNPFNPATQINYQIPKDGNVKLVVYNSLGQEIKTLVNQYQSGGSYVVQFDASELPSGVYIYKLTSGNFSAVKKMLLTK